MTTSVRSVTKSIKSKSAKRRLSFPLKKRQPSSVGSSANPLPSMSHVIRPMSGLRATSEEMAFETMAGAFE